MNRIATMKLVDDYKNIRLPDYDYKNGWFFVTNKTSMSKPLLANAIHDLVKYELKTIHARCAGVSLDYATIVPNHVHCILILEGSEFPLSEVWRRFKARTSYFAKKNKSINSSIWQRNYYEHTIRNEGALDRIKEYIKNNPLKENLDFNEIYKEK